MRTYIWIFTESVGNPLEDQLLPMGIILVVDSNSNYCFPLQADSHSSALNAVHVGPEPGSNSFRELQSYNT